jgi:aspartate/methionine/tyrosine aminotransferase
LYINDFPARRAMTSKTKMIIVNTPHNPVGKVFTKSELERIADLAKEFNVMVLADEVVRLVFPLYDFMLVNLHT